MYESLIDDKESLDILVGKLIKKLGVQNLQHLDLNRILNNLVVVVVQNERTTVVSIIHKYNSRCFGCGVARLDPHDEADAALGVKIAMGRALDHITVLFQMSHIIQSIEE